MRLWRGVVALFVALAGGAWPETRPLTILHINDLHARFLPDESGSGGFAHLATAIRRQRAGCSGCLLLVAGDLVQGTPVSTIFRGVPAFEVANLFGIDVFTLGNHEFDYGAKMIPEFIRKARFPVISANVADARGRLLAERPYVIKTVNGVRVAVIGAVMNNLLAYTTPDKLKPWRALPVAETIRKYLAEMRARSDLIVLLGHLTDPETHAILGQLPEVDVFIMGHDHQGLETPLQLDGRMLVYVKGYGVELGRLDLEVDIDRKKVASWNWKKIPIEARSFPPAEDVARSVRVWEARVAQVVDVRIGESRREIAGAELKALIERAMREETGAALAFVNRGGIRDKLPKGRILARHVWNIMPFDDTVVIGRFKGSALPQAVAAAADPNREYSLVVNEFSAINQKTALRTEGLVFPRTGPPLRDLLLAWIKKQQVLD